MEKNVAFQIELADNVATALAAIEVGAVAMRGDATMAEVEAITEVPVGHKIAIKPIAAGDKIMKYNVVIGRATKDIQVGEWVHLHNMESIYDERSSHLDAVTGAPKDTIYE